MVNIKADNGECNIHCSGQAYLCSAELICIIHSAIEAFANTRKISYDAAKIEVMRQVAMVEQQEKEKNNSEHH